MLKPWAILFAMTYLLELPIYQGLLRRVVRLRQGLLLCLALNVATHPIVWFVWPIVLENQLHYVLVAEAFAVLVEATLLWGMARWKRWPDGSWLSFVGVAFLANAFSVAVGEIAGYPLLHALGLFA